MLPFGSEAGGDVGRRRRGGGALFSYRRRCSIGRPASHYVSTGSTPFGYTWEANFGRLLRGGAPGTHPLYQCQSPSDSRDRFLSYNRDCEGSIYLGLEGYAYDSSQSDTTQIFRCLSGAGHFISVAANCEGTTVEGSMGFTAGAPAAQTIVASAISETQATLNASVDPRGLSTSYRFQWGTTTSYGSTTPEANGGFAPGAVARNATLTGLLPGTTYHYRVVVSSADGTRYGADRVFRTGINWILRNSNSGGGADITPFFFGLPGHVRVSGDWDGDGKDTPGVFDSIPGIWKLRNSNSAGAPDLTFQYGGSQYKPVVGDWNGDGKDTIGVFEPIAGQWCYRNTNSAGASDSCFQYGGSQYTPVPADWNGDGKDTIGVFEPIAGQWCYRNTNSAGASDSCFQFGGPTFSPIVGNWDGIGGDSVGLTQAGVE